MSKYIVAFEQHSKGVNASVTVEEENGEDCLAKAKELFEKAQKAAREFGGVVPPSA